MNNFLSGPELEEFVKKVERLKAEGLSTQAVMERLGVPRSTLALRLRRYRETRQMKSKNDPILDAQQLCADGPKTEQEVLDGLKAFGWHEEVCKQALDAAKGSYVREVDGKLVAGAGTATDVVRKVMSSP